MSSLTNLAVFFSASTNRMMFPPGFVATAPTCEPAVSRIITKPLSPRETHQALLKGERVSHENLQGLAAFVQRFEPQDDSELNRLLTPYDRRTAPRWNCE